MKSSSPSPAEAARELLIRRRARENLVAYANTIDIPGAALGDEPDDADDWVFQPIETTVAKHHNLLLSALQNTVETPNGRLMVFMPPGTAKSTYGSIVLPTWCMGKWPNYPIMLGTYGGELSKKHGRRARSIVQSDRFRQVMGTSISSNQGAAHDWALENGSSYLATSIIGAATGNRARGIIIDDPVKNRRDAESPAIRKQTRDEFEDSFRSRRLPGCWIIIIQTRWHDDDLAGSILPEGYAGENGPILCRDGDVWNVVCLPAEAERADDPLGRKPGEFIWPEFYGPEHWAQPRRNPRTWSALYQQRPAPLEGSFFLRDWFRTYPGAIPDRRDLRIYGGSDYAVTANGGDWTVHMVVGIDADNRMILLDVWRGQTDSMVWVETLLDMVSAWRPLQWAEETGQIKASVGPWLERRMIERKVYVPRSQFPTRGDKAVRAQSIRGRMALLGLYVPEGAPWFSALLGELLSFDAGRNDDQVDALGLVGQLLDQMERGGERVLQQTADDTWTPHGEAGPPRLRGPQDMSDGDLQQIADGGDWKPW